MMRASLTRLVPAAFALAFAPGAAAEVVGRKESGFVSRFEAETKAPPTQAWQALIAPGRWWSGEHTYSGDPANLSLDARAGGCFCEKLPAAAATPAGSIEHMRVVFIQPGRALRLSGALGPLQAEAVTATLTVTLKPAGAGARLTWEYVVGGYMRFPTAEIAPLVDQVMGEQFGRLVARLGPLTSPSPAAAAVPGTAKPPTPAKP